MSIVRVQHIASDDDIVVVHRVRQPVLGEPESLVSTDRLRPGQIVTMTVLPGDALIVGSEREARHDRA